MINEYIDERLCATDYLGEIELKDSKDYFEDLSYARWAAYEIIERLNNESERLPPHITGSWREPFSPADIVLEFVDDMEHCIYDCRGEKHERIFSIALYVAEDVLYLYLKGEKNEQIKPV